MEVLLEEEMEVDDRYTRALINKVISDGITDSDPDNQSNLNHKRKKKK